MSPKSAARQLALASLMSLFLSGCYHPPYNNFKPYNSMPKNAAKGVGIGAVVGVVASQASSGLIPGAAIAGGVAGTMVSLYKDSKPSIIRELYKEDIQYVEYGDTMTLIVPVDRYYVFNTPQLNDICYPGLINIVKLLKLYSHSPIYVAGFTDNIGSRHNKKMMSQAQAETMVTFLWANGIQSQRLAAEGYGDKNNVSENSIIHGSAQNRRIEIQWFNNSLAQAPAIFPMAEMTK